MTASFDQKNSVSLKLRDCYPELMDHQHAALNKKLEQTFSLDESVNKFGLTFLQQTAREGMIEASLRLMREGALVVPKPISDKDYQCANVRSVKENTRKTPCDFAKERGHALLADIIAMYEDSNCVIDNTIRHAVLFWLVENDRSGDVYFPTITKAPAVASDEKHSGFADPNAASVSRLIEFAAFRKNKKLVEYFLKSGKLINDASQLSAGYWAAVNDDAGIGQLVCVDDDSVVLKLQQLLDMSGKADLFIKHLEAATADQRKKYDDAIGIVIDKSALTAKQQKIYQALAIAQRDIIKSFMSSDEDRIACAEYALKTQNFVVLSELKRITADHEVFLAKLCQQNKKDLVRFWLIANNIDPFEFVLKNLAENQVVKFIIENCSSELGFLHYIVSRNVKLSPSFRRKEEMVLLQNHFGEDPSRLLDVFLKCLNDINPDRAIDSLLASKAASIELRVQGLTVPLYIKRLITDRLFRLGIRVELANNAPDQKFLDKKEFFPKAFSRIPSVQIKLINTFLTKKESAQFGVTSSSIYKDLILSDEKNQNVLNNRLDVLKRQLNLIEKFETTVAADQEQKTYTSDRVCCDCDERYCCCGEEAELASDWAYYTTISFSVLGTVSAGISAWQTWMLSGTLSERIDLCDEFETTFAPSQGNQSCYALQTHPLVGPVPCFSMTECADYWKTDVVPIQVIGIVAECVNLCNRLLPLELDGVGEGFGAVPTAIYALIAFLVIWRIRNSIRGPERFELQPVTDYSDETLKTVKDLFDEVNYQPKLAIKVVDAKTDAKLEMKDEVKTEPSFKMPEKSKADFSKLSTASTIKAIRDQAAIVKEEFQTLSRLNGASNKSSEEEKNGDKNTSSASAADAKYAAASSMGAAVASHLGKFAANAVPVKGLDDDSGTLREPLLNP